MTDRDNRRASEEDQHNTCAPAACGKADVANERERICVPTLREGHGAFRVFTEGDELYDAMVDAIAGAERDIRMESYIFAADEVGQRFAAALAAKARAGVQVYLHLDALGSGSTAFIDIQRHLELAGVKFKWFHRFRWLHPLEYIQRNHRKLLVVDHRDAFLGGFNIRRLN